MRTFLWNLTKFGSRMLPFLFDPVWVLRPHFQPAGNTASCLFQTFPLLTLCTFCMSQVPHQLYFFSVFFSCMKKPTSLENPTFWHHDTISVFLLVIYKSFFFRELHHLHERGIWSSLREWPLILAMKRYLICLRKIPRTILMIIMWGIGHSWIQ